MRSTLALLFFSTTSFLSAQGGLVYEGPQHFTRHPIAWSVRAADLDGDGDLDLLFGETMLSKMAIGINDGMGRFPFPHVPLNAPTAGMLAFGDAAPGDLDGDADLDIVTVWLWVNGQAATSSGTPTVFENQNGKFSISSKFQLPAIKSDMRRLHIVDIDKDGDADIIVGCGSFGGGGPAQPSFLLLNDGKGRFSVSTSFPNTPTRVAGIQVLDMDADGHLDIVFANGYPSTIQEDMVLFGDQYGGFTVVNLGSEREIAHCCAVADLDRDGRPDVVVGNWSAPARIYWNDGNRNFSTTQLPRTLSDTNGIAIVDIDRDGWMDIVASGSPLYSIPKPINLTVFRNLSGRKFTDATAALMIGSAKTIIQSATCGDFDGDGDDDVVLSPRNMVRNHYSQLHGQAKASRDAPYRLDISAPASSVMNLAVGAVRKTLPIPGWGTLHLDPASMLILPQIFVQQNNAASMVFNVPNDPRLVNLDVFFQGLRTTLKPRVEQHLTNLFGVKVQ